MIIPVATILNNHIIINEYCVKYYKFQLFRIKKRYENKYFFKKIESIRL